MSTTAHAAATVQQVLSKDRKALDALGVEQQAKPNDPLIIPASFVLDPSPHDRASDPGSNSDTTGRIMAPNTPLSEHLENVHEYISDMIRKRTDHGGSPAKQVHPTR
jgi:hypothetical protein